MPQKTEKKSEEWENTSLHLDPLVYKQFGLRCHNFVSGLDRSDRGVN